MMTYTAPLNVTTSNPFTIQKSIQLNTSESSIQNDQALQGFDLDKNGSVSFDEFKNSNFFVSGPADNVAEGKFTSLQLVMKNHDATHTNIISEFTKKNRIEQKKTDLLHIEKHKIEMDLKLSKSQLESFIDSQKNIPSDKQNPNDYIQSLEKYTRLMKTDTERLNGFNSAHSDLGTPSVFLLKLLQTQQRTEFTDPNYANLESEIDRIEASEYPSA
ncbi:MAG: hypothetical protein HEQ32_07215 [Vampirovibrio sp.]